MILISLYRSGAKTMKVWFSKFGGSWTVAFGKFRFDFKASGGWITINKHRLRLVISTSAAFPAISGWFKFASGGYLYYIHIVKHQIFRFSVKPNRACRKAFKGIRNFCGTGKVTKGHPVKKPSKEILRTTQLLKISEC